MKRRPTNTFGHRLVEYPPTRQEMSRGCDGGIGLQRCRSAAITHLALYAYRGHRGRVDGRLALCNACAAQFAWRWSLAQPRKIDFVDCDACYRRGRVDDGTICGACRGYGRIVVLAEPGIEDGPRALARHGKA